MTQVKTGVMEMKEVRVKLRTCLVETMALQRLQLQTIRPGLLNHLKDGGEGPRIDDHDLHNLHNKVSETPQPQLQQQQLVPEPFFEHFNITTTKNPQPIAAAAIRINNNTKLINVTN